MFDIASHLIKIKKQPFFEEKNYTDLLLDAQAFASLIEQACPDQFIALKMKSPYLAFAAQLGCLFKNKTAVFVSHLENKSSINTLKAQVPFNYILTDDDYSKLARHSVDFSEPVSMEQMACVVFSSGSSSLPKGIVLSLGNLYFSSLGFIEFFNQTSADRSCLNLSHHHVGGLMVLWRAFISGSSVTTNTDEAVDFISLVPLQLKRMLKNTQDVKRLQKIRVILIGGAPLTQELKQEALNLGLSLYETYGMSESASQLLINGQLLPYRELKIDDEGFFHINGKTRALGLFEKKQFKQITGWYKTSDKGRKDGNKFQFVERHDLVFICGGENINPLFIEEEIRHHPGVAEAYLLPIEDDLWGQIGILLYEGDIGVTELLDYLKSKLHPYLVPKHIFKFSFKTHMGIKPKRSALKEEAYRLYLKFIFSFKVIEHKNDLAPVAVFFHGFMGDNEDLLDIAEPFKKDHTLLFIDLPGHGKTQASHFYHFDDFFRKLSAFIKLFSNQYVFYGYSMGGRIAMHLALYFIRPTLLIVESAGLGLMNQQEQNARLKADTLMLDIASGEKLEFLMSWYSVPMFAPYFKSERFLSDCQKKCLHDFLEWQQSQRYLSSGAFPLKATVMEGLNNYPGQIIYIFGQMDEKYKAMAVELKELSNIALFEIPKAGHNPHKTHVSEITTILSKTLK